MSRRDAGTKFVPTVLLSLSLIYFPINNVLYGYVLCLRLFYYIISNEIVEKTQIYSCHSMTSWHEI